MHLLLRLQLFLWFYHKAHPSMMESNCISKNLEGQGELSFCYWWSSNHFIILELSISHLLKKNVPVSCINSNPCFYIESAVATIILRIVTHWMLSLASIILAMVSGYFNAAKKIIYSFFSGQPLTLHHFDNLVNYL